MIDLKTFNVKDNFFGARNSHDGFKSAFGEIFSPTKYQRLFILKGGPGTGKSTILRGVISFANSVGITASAVLCSSDVTSLDGAILEHNGKRIAVIDGTAPHVQDPQLPGAVDEILNLGDGFDQSQLEGKRTEIVGYTKEKAQEYKKAYSVLFAAKAIFNYIYNQLQFSAFYNEAEYISEEVLKDVKNSSVTPESCGGIYSAFGKDGLFSLAPVGRKSIIRIKGNELLSSMILEGIKRQAEKKGMTAFRYPSALDDRICERVCIGGTVIISSADATDGIDISDYLPGEYCDGFNNIYGSYTSLLHQAMVHFGNASSAHLLLEKIYRKAVDFEKNEILFTTLCQRIGEILL